MTMTESSPIELCKLLLDENRLKILGRLALHAATVEELRTTLGIKERELTRHLQQLQAAGLITTAGDGPTEQFSFDIGALHRYKKQLFAPAENTAQSESDKTLAAFVKAGVLTGLPVQPAKVPIVLAWVAELIPPGVAYDERAINELLKGHAVDHVTLRRLLIDYGFMTRTAGIYQRAEPQSA